MDADGDPALDRLRELAPAEDDRPALGPRALLATRRQARERGRRLRLTAWPIAQCAVAAAVSWVLAGRLLGHEQPFFAPVAAVIALGTSFGDRWRRVAEVVVGVALGVLVGDLFVTLVGPGSWQLAVVVAVAMSLAVLLDAGHLITTQAGVQAVIVTTLLPADDSGLGRWLDAVVGGAVALAIAALVPRSALYRPRHLAADVVAAVADLLQEAARSAADGDLQRATRALERARATQPALDTLREAAQEGLDSVRGSVLRRRYRGQAEDVVSLVEPLDHAVRNVRVLARRITVAAWRGEPVPQDLVALVERLAGATHALALDLAPARGGGDAVALLTGVGEASSTLPRSLGLSGSVVLAQLRSVVVDLLQVAGHSQDEALAAVPRLVPGTSGPSTTPDTSAPSDDGGRTP